MRPLTLLTWGLATLALFWLGFAADVLWLRLATKAFPALALAAFAYRRAEPMGRLIAGGLALGSVGDVVLEAGYFLPGLVAFLFGHLAYVVAFVRDERALRPRDALAPALFVGVIVSLLWDRLGPMRVPVVIYSTTIGAMIWRAAARAEARDDRYGAIALAGAITFALSDGIIAINKFYAPVTGGRVAILLTYWLAQTLIAFGVPPHDAKPA